MHEFSGLIRYGGLNLQFHLLPVNFVLLVCVC